MDLMSTQEPDGTPYFFFKHFRAHDRQLMVTAVLDWGVCKANV